MGYYSFIAIATHPVGIQNPLICLDKGVNAFTAVTDDLEGLKKVLEAEGVTIQKVNQLDGLEPVPLETALLPGESAEALHLLSDSSKVGQDEDP